MDISNIDANSSTLLQPFTEITPIFTISSNNNNNNSTTNNSNNNNSYLNFGSSFSSSLVTNVNSSSPAPNSTDLSSKKGRIK